MSAAQLYAAYLETADANGYEDIIWGAVHRLQHDWDARHPRIPLRWDRKGPLMCWTALPAVWHDYRIDTPTFGAIACNLSRIDRHEINGPPSLHQRTGRAQKGHWYISVPCYMRLHSTEEARQAVRNRETVHNGVPPFQHLFRSPPVENKTRDWHVAQFRGLPENHVTLP